MVHVAAAKFSLAELSVACTAAKIGVIHAGVTPLVLSPLQWQ